MSAAEFVPVGVVGFSGSRFGSPFGVTAAVASVYRSKLPVVVGCQRGVDSVVRCGIPASRLTVFSASDPQYLHLPLPVRFAARTVACVSAADCLLAFAPTSGLLGRGTTLAIRTAIKRGIPVFVACPESPLSVAAVAWVESSFVGERGWAFIPSQTTLF